jgi:hypothetical protein
VTVNSLTTRPGKVNVSGRRTSARRTFPSPEFLTRSSTREGSGTSSWRVSTFQTAQVELSLASLGSAPILASIWSRQVILRHRAIFTGATFSTAAIAYRLRATRNSHLHPDHSPVNGNRIQGEFLG